jgi:hypothetical protein
MGAPPWGEHDHIAHVGAAYYEGITLEQPAGVPYNLSAIDSVECRIETENGELLLEPTAAVVTGRAAFGEIDITDTAEHTAEVPEGTTAVRDVRVIVDGEPYIVLTGKVTFRRSVFT